jgi:hypothetical protein
MRGEDRGQAFGKAARQRVLEPDADQRPAAFGHSQEDRDARLRRPHRHALAGGFDHRDGVLRWVDVLQRRAGKVELVAEDESQALHRRDAQVTAPGAA